MWAYVEDLFGICRIGKGLSRDTYGLYTVLGLMTPDM